METFFLAIFGLSIAAGLGALVGRFFTESKWIDRHYDKITEVRQEEYEIRDGNRIAFAAEIAALRQKHAEQLAALRSKLDDALATASAAEERQHQDGYKKALDDVLDAVWELRDRHVETATDGNAEEAE